MKFSAVLLLSLGVSLSVGCASPEEKAAVFTRKAQAALAKGEISTAKLEAMNAIQVQPKNSKARYVLAQIAEQQGEISQMLGELAMVVGEDKTNVEARVKLATTLIYAQDYAGAAALSKAAVALAPQDPAVVLLQARVALTQNELPQAILLLNRVITSDPRNGDAALLRGMAYAETDADRGLEDLAASVPRVSLQATKALRQARILILKRAKRPAEVEAELVALVADFPSQGLEGELVEFYVANDMPEKAEATLRTAVLVDPTNTFKIIALVQFQSRVQRKPELAEQTLKKFIAAAPDNLGLRVLLGTFYEATQRRAQALTSYRVAATKGPKTMEGLQARGRIATLEILTDAKQSRESFDLLIEDAPDDVLGLVGRGELNFMEQRYADAVIDLRAALRSAPKNQLGLLILAETHTKMGEAKLAEDAYRRLLQVNPDSPEAALGLSQLVVRSGRVDESIDLLKRVLAVQPDNALARSGLIDGLVAQKKFTEAETEARALAASPDPQGLGALQLGQVLLLKNDFNGALPEFQRALDRSPVSLQALEGYVQTLVVQRKLSQTETFLRSYLRANPEQWNGEVMLAAVLLDQGKVEEGRKVLELVLAEHPKVVRGWSTLADSYSDDPAARLRVLKEGLQAAPRGAALVLAIAATYEAQGKGEAAIATYEDYLALAPDDYQASNELAALLLDYRPTKVSVQRALDLSQRFADSRSPQLLDTLGWANYRKGDQVSAVRFLELAVALGGEANPIVRYHLGMAYLAGGNPVGSKAELTKALALGKGGFPGAKEAKATLDKLQKTPAPS